MLIAVFFLVGAFSTAASAPTGPVGFANSAHVAPRMSDEGGYPRVINEEPLEDLNVQSMLPRADAHLLFVLGGSTRNTTGGYSATVGDVAFEVDTRLWVHFNRYAIEQKSSFSKYVIDEDGALVSRDSSGRILWRADRDLTGPVSEGPDGNAYLLVADPDTTLRSVRVYEAGTGRLLRQGQVGSQSAVLVSSVGYVFAVDPLSVLTGRPEETRRPFVPGPAEMASGESVTPTPTPGEVVIYNFWASWCGPCREEMPELIRLADDMERVRLVTLNDDVTPLHGDLFLRDLNLTPEVWYGFGRYRARYGYAGLPTTVLVDQEGREIYSWTGFGGEVQLDAIRALATLATDESGVGTAE